MLVDFSAIFEMQFSGESCDALSCQQLYSSVQPLENKQSEMNIQMLNEDCLQYIFGFLEFEDRLVLGTTCQRFYQATRPDVATWEMLTCKDMDHMTRRLNPQLFFSTYGPDIRQVCVNRPNYDRLSLMLEYCHNLEYLQLEYPDVKSCGWLKLFTKLRTLKIHGFRELDDFMLRQIGSLKNLEVLHINNEPICGSCLDGLTTLTELKLTRCKLHSKHFVEILESNRNLKKLTLPEYLDCDVSRCLVATQKNLEYLSFGDWAFESYNFLAELPPLKHVDVMIDLDLKSGEKIIHELALHHAESLEALSCRFSDRLEILSCTESEQFQSKCWSKMLSAQQLVDFLNHTKSLTYLEVPLELSVNLYRQIVHIRRNLNATEPLTLVVEYSNRNARSDTEIMLRKEYRDEKKFVEIKVAPIYGSHRETNITKRIKLSTFGCFV